MLSFIADVPTRVPMQGYQFPVPLFAHSPTLRLSSFPPDHIVRQSARLNRYMDVMPADKHRVDLGEKHYINASVLDFNDMNWIAAMAPIPDTFEHFYQMVVERDVDVIVCLANTSELKSHRLHKYWPDTVERFGLFHVERLGLESRDGYVVHTLGVQRDGVARNVVLMHFLEWPDRGVPSGESMLHFVNFYMEYARLSSRMPIVHCSAGIGRTGTFTVIDAMVRLHRQGVDVRERDYFSAALGTFRDQRPGMVQNASQWHFCFEAVRNIISLLENNDISADQHA